MSALVGLVLLNGPRIQYHNHVTHTYLQSIKQACVRNVRRMVWFRRSERIWHALVTPPCCTLRVRRSVGRTPQLLMKAVHVGTCIHSASPAHCDRGPKGTACAVVVGIPARQVSASVQY